MKNKKIISLVLAFVMLFASFVPTYAITEEVSQQISPRYANVKAFEITVSQNNRTLSSECKVTTLVTCNVNLDITLQKYSSSRGWYDYQSYSTNFSGPSAKIVNKLFSNLSTGTYRVKADITIQETPTDNDTIYSETFYI